MKRKILSRVIPIAFLFAFFSPDVFAQCTEQQPSGCLCIYICTFSTTKNGCAVTLQWTTETEPSGDSQFEIWRSSDAVNYIRIATVNGNPGSVSHLNYSYADNTPYNPSGNIYYYIRLLNYGTLIQQTSIKRVVSDAGQCPGNLNGLCGSITMNGFSSPLANGGTEQLSLSGSAPQPITWTSSNTSVATVSSNGLVTAVGPGTATITGTYAVCGTSVSNTLTVPPPPYTPTANPCSGIYTSGTIFGNAGDVVVMKLDFGGYLMWNGMANGTGSYISMSCGGSYNTTSTSHYYGSTGFSLSTQITFTMPSSSVNYNTTVVVNNSSTMYSSTATLTVVSVNGVPYGTQGTVCGGNSAGYW